MTRENRQRRKRRLLTPLALVITAYFVWFCYSRITYRPDPRLAYWESRFREINPEAPGMVPCEEAADVSMQGARLYSVWKSKPDAYDPFTALSGPWDPATNAPVSEARALFASDDFRTEYARFKDIVRHGWAVSSGWNDDSVQEFSGFRSWAILLLTYSRFLQEEHQDLDAQYDVWRRILEASDCGDSSRECWRLVTSEDIRAMVSAYAIVSCREGREDRRIPMADDFLTPDAYLDQPVSTRVARSIAHERAHFDRIFVADGGWLDVSTAIGVNWRTDPCSRLWNLTSFVYFSRDEAEKTFAGYVTRLDRCANAAAMGKAFDDYYECDLSPSVLMLYGRSGWRGAYQYYLRTTFLARTCSEATAATIALHNYRADRGAYPDTLDELVPTYLRRPPIDFGDGATLRYQRIDLTYQLYSVGYDGVDHHGVTIARFNTLSSEWDTKGSDVSFDALTRADWSPR
ncbi:MAG TPA: hypothetical protein P5081_07900 [Phycisphaerae bacterium]|nr:hypothetical protein [Phycisphaerae bacterium]HRW52795.1 hypothetical protein [Phycisphaerae bacterium]